MTLLSSFSMYYCQAVISSQFTLKPKNSFPKIKKIVIFLVVSLKQYKKNILLCYVISYLLMSNTLIFNNKKIQQHSILKFLVKTNFFLIFFFNFVNVYLPLLSSDQNTIKKSIVQKVSSSQQFMYRLQYFTFPVIPEMELICYNNEFLSRFISNNYLQIDIYIQSAVYIKSALEILLRFFRLPCNIVRRGT